MKLSKRKQEIYTTSAKLFRKKGYSATSIRDIAELVGLEPSSLYSHIKSKEEILINICFECAEMFDKGQKEIMSRELSSIEAIIALVDLHIDIALYHPSSVTVFNDEWRHMPDKELELFLKKRKIYEDTFKKVVDRGIEEGSIEKISPSIAINMIINSLRWIHFQSDKITEKSLDIKKSEIKNFIQRGLQTIK